MADGEENLLGEDQLAANMQAAGQQQQGAGQQPPPAPGPAGQGQAAGQGQQQQAQGQQQQGVPADLQALALAQGHEQAMNEAVARIRALNQQLADRGDCLLYTSPSPRDLSTSRMPSSA